MKPETTEPIKSPFMEGEAPEQFDYNKYQDDTTIVAARLILKYMGEHPELFIFTHEEKQEDVMVKASKAAEDIMTIVAETKVPQADLSKLSDILTNAPFSTFTIISKHYNELEKELLARTMGVRDPGTNKYSREFSSIGDLVQTLIRVRNEQGNNVEDYFTVTKPETKE